MADEEYDYPPQVQQTAAYGAMEKLSAGMSLGSLRHPPVRKIVEAQIAELKKQLAEREAFLEDLNKSPDVERLLDRMRKLSI